MTPQELLDILRPLSPYPTMDPDSDGRQTTIQFSNGYPSSRYQGQIERMRDDLIRLMGGVPDESVGTRKLGMQQHDPERIQTKPGRRG